jgi:hypothetical protein
MAMVFELPTPPGEIEAILDYFTNPHLVSEPELSGVGRTIMDGLFDLSITTRYELGEFRIPDALDERQPQISPWDPSRGPDVLYTQGSHRQWLKTARGVLVPDYVQPQAAFKIVRIPKLQY